MKQKEILAMKPGLELNKKVAEQVIGHQVAKDEIFGYVEGFTDEADDCTVWDTLQSYSEDMLAAEIVVKRMIALGHDDAIYWADFGGGVYSEPEAICKAALIALLE